MRHLLATSREQRLVAASENQRKTVVYGALDCLRVPGRAIDSNTSGLASAASGRGEFGLERPERRSPRSRRGPPAKSTDRPGR